VTGRPLRRSRCSSNTSPEPPETNFVRTEARIKCQHQQRG
jgi:hypothetical protein